MRLRGNVISKEKYGLTMLVKDFEFLDIEDIAKKAEMMLEELRW
jgi:replication factor A1